MISGLVAHSSTCPSAVGEPAQSPAPPFSPGHWPPCSGMDYAELAVPVGLRPQAAYPVTLDKGCLPLSLPVCLAGEGAGSAAGLGATHAQECSNL